MALVRIAADVHPVYEPLESHIRPTCASSGLKMDSQNAEKVERCGEKAGEDRMFTQRLPLAEGDVAESRNAQARWICCWQLHAESCTSVYPFGREREANINGSNCSRQQGDDVFIPRPTIELLPKQ